MEDSDSEIEPCDFDVNAINEQEQCNSNMEETENNNTTIASSTEAKIDFSEPAYSLKRFFNYQRGDQMAKCRICSRRIGRKDQSTSGLLRHLKVSFMINFNFASF